LEGLDDRAPEARIVHGVVGIPADAWVIASVVARLFLLDGVPAEAAAPTVRKGLEGRLAHELVDVLVRGLSRIRRRPSVARSLRGSVPQSRAPRDSRALVRARLTRQRSATTYAVPCVAV
jgi:hypothetical protein